MLVDRRAAAGSLRLLRDGRHALGLTAHECELGSLPSELDRGGAADAAESLR